MIDPENLGRILAVVGPRRTGKTYFMYQLIQSLLVMLDKDLAELYGVETRVLN